MNFAVLVSGYGSNLQAIIDAVRAKAINANLVLVVSNKKDAYALKRAEAAGIKTVFIDPKEFSSREDFDQAVINHLDTAKVDFVVLAGFMRLLSPIFIFRYPNRILNVHPSLLPQFKGAHAIRDAFNAAAAITGVTIHFVNAEMDEGAVIAQEKVKVTDNDTLKTLEEKIHQVEHHLYPKIIALFADGKIKVDGQIVTIMN